MTSDHQALSVLVVVLAAAGIAAMYLLPRHFDCSEVDSATMKSALQDCYQSDARSHQCGEVVRMAMCKELP